MNVMKTKGFEDIEDAILKTGKETSSKIKKGATDLGHSLARDIDNLPLAGKGTKSKGKAFGWDL